MSFQKAGHFGKGKGQFESYTDLCELWGLLEHGDLVAGAPQGDGRRKSSQTSTDDQDIQFHPCFRGRNVFTRWPGLGAFQEAQGI